AAAMRADIKRNPFHPFSTFDTATLAGLAYGHTVLAQACKLAGIPFDNKEAHSAAYDAEKTADRFCGIVNRWQELGGYPPPVIRASDESARDTRNTTTRTTRVVWRLHSGSPVDASHNRGERHLLGRYLRLLTRLTARRRRRIREHTVTGVHDDLAHLRCQRMQYRRKHTQPGSDTLRTIHNRIRHHLCSFLRRQRRHRIVNLGRCDHRRFHQRHVNGGKRQITVRPLSCGTT